tara:strand:+ start:77 stop:604 length:528 start_codon:yes stop_codon:yes gene_type:complete
MKNTIISLLMLISSTILFAQSSFHEIQIEDINGSTLNLNDFKGKYVLVVNVASNCGYTKQYSDLEKLYQEYDNLVVLGVPCNQFANQEPKNEKEILQFCKQNYNVSFPMTSKINVKGKSKHPLYQWLTEKEKNKIGDFRISWNFNKFLINPDGNLIEHFGSSIKPFNKKIKSLIK